MRKAISTVAVACALVAGASGVASASQTGHATQSTHVATRRCNTRYTAACTAPKIKTKPVSAKCVSTGHTLTLPSMTFTSNAGLRRIQVQVGGRTIKLVTFRGQGKTQYRLNGLTLSTAGLGVGGHPVVVKVMDIRGRTATKTLRFAVCVSTPVFTG